MGHRSVVFISLFTDFDSPDNCGLERRNAISNCIKNEFGIKLEIAVCKTIAHSDNVYPRNFRKMGTEKTRDKSVYSVNSFPYGSNKSAIGRQ